jgi:hypothetical protein
MRNGEVEQRLQSWQVCALVKYFRQELDLRGLHDVKILAPETSNVDDVAYDMIDEIVADSLALASTFAWATHSYNLCLTKKMRDKVAPYGKEYWQTEASSDDPESFNDELEAAKAAGRVLGDLNLGVTQWFWFLAYAPFLPESNTPRLIGFDQQTGEYRAFLKYYYLKHISHAFNPGTVFRTCSTSLVFEDDHMFSGKDRYAWMENDHGQKPPLCAASGINPDGTWSLAVVNQTGIYSSWEAAVYHPETVYDVTFDVAELRDSGEKKFDSFISSGSGNLIRHHELVMVGGKITVTVKPRQLITLWPRSKTIVGAYESTAGHIPTANLPVNVTGLRQVSKDGFIITYTLPYNQKDIDCRLSVFDMQGRFVALVSQGLQSPGSHSVTWNGKTKTGRIAAGIYALVLEAESMRACINFPITER